MLARSSTFVSSLFPHRRIAWTSRGTVIPVCPRMAGGEPASSSESASSAAAATSASWTVAEEHFSVQNCRGEKLSALLCKPAENGNAQFHASSASCGNHVIVIAHGYRDSKRGIFVEALSRELLPRMTIRFDMSGNGDSDGQFQFANYEDEMEDIRAVVAHARRVMQLQVDCIIGHSKGAGDVLLYASKYRDVDSVINIAARFHMAAGLDSRFGAQVLEEVERNGRAMVTQNDGFSFELTAAALASRRSLDMGDVARRIPNTVRVLTIHGDADTVIPVKDAFEYQTCITNHDLRVLKDASHNFRGREAEVAALVEQFLSQSHIAGAAG